MTRPTFGQLPTTIVALLAALALAVAALMLTGLGPVGSDSAGATWNKTRPGHSLAGATWNKVAGGSTKGATWN